MASYHVFTDLPRIHVDENGPLHDGYVSNPFGGEFENCWNPTMKTTMRTSLTSGTGFPFMTSNVHTGVSLQRYLLDQGRGALPPQGPLAQYGFHAWRTFDSQQDQYSSYEAQSPYPFVDTDRPFVSSEGSWQDDGSATELTSSSAGSDWSPRSSTGDIYSGGFQDFELKAQYSQDRETIIHSQHMLLHAGYASTIPQRPLLGRSKSDSCVALREVQQYPDTIELEDVQDEDIKMEYHFSKGNDDTSLKIDRGEEDIQQHRDEDLDSSVQEESVEPSVVDAGEEQYESDYTPRPRKKRSQSSQTSTTPKSPTKRSPRQRRTSQKDNAKITKRSSPQKSCSQHPKRSFKTASEYKKHIQAHHLRPFACTLAHYGCPSTFGSKNEWKRHVSSQHLSLGFWRCDQGTCTHDPSRPNDFNRKDLFTQHLRRMHAPTSPKSSSSTTAAANKKSEFEAGLENIRERCFVVRRSPPKKSRCEVCGKSFEGRDSWDERMEHVGKHFERADVIGKIEDAGKSLSFVDEDLKAWLLNEGLLEAWGKGWRLVDSKCMVGGRREGLVDSDVDAEAEDE